MSIISLWGKGQAACTGRSGFKGWWACFLGGCVHPRELGSPPCALLLTPGPNLLQLLFSPRIGLILSSSWLFLSKSCLHRPLNYILQTCFKTAQVEFIKSCRSVLCWYISPPNSVVDARRERGVWSVSVLRAGPSVEINITVLVRIIYPKWIYIAIWQIYVWTEPWQNIYVTRPVFKCQEAITLSQKCLERVYLKHVCLTGKTEIQWRFKIWESSDSMYDLHDVKFNKAFE